tara:strand:- start:360 stop:785 length:426 start_codon:yes stop_codon:yes gene_type:complete
MDWRQQGKIWQLRPSRPLGQVDFIGGSYLAATPQVSYRRLLEDLSNNGLVVNAWAYVPGFDHQSQAREAWTEFRSARKQLEERYGQLPLPLRLGHSLGCKLQPAGSGRGEEQPRFGGFEFQQFPGGSFDPPARGDRPTAGG